MKKRLLLGFMALCTFVAGHALTVGEYVYTPQGRFNITGSNSNANSAFTDFAGWTLVSVQDGKTIDAQFNINGNGYAEGINSVVSLDATAGEGMYYKFEPSDPSKNYVVSYKMKAGALTSIRVKTVAVSTNLVKVEGNSDNSWGGTTDVALANTAEELNTDWQTFNYAIVGDGTTRTYFISFTGMATDIEIADLQIAEAVQYADLRLRDAMVEKLNAYKNCYDWQNDEPAEYGIDDAIATLQAIGEQDGVDVLNKALVGAQEVLDGFLKGEEACMDDYLAGGSNLDYLPNNVGKQGSRKSSYGIWTCIPGDRGHWDANAYPDMGHYQSANTWNNGSPTSPMGMTTLKDLSVGSYVFSIGASAALREPKKNDWNNDDGYDPAYAEAYIVKIVDGAATDTIVSDVKDVTSDPVNLTRFILTAKIEEEGTYEFGCKTYCKEAYQAFKLGSVSYFGDASIYGKNDNKYSQAQLNYEIDVRKQITAGREAVDKANTDLADATLLWGKAELKACVDTVAPKIAAYELLTQDEIIATYDSYYKKNVDSEDGIMVYEVYQSAVKDILAANKKFTAVNDSLNSIQIAIDNAEKTMSLRIYDAATGKDALTAAINTAKGVQAEMKASKYSEENVQTILAANATLSEAVETFKASVPADAITTIIDIDFENAAAMNEETQLYSITGANGTMEFSNFSAEPAAVDAIAYQQGLWDNGVQNYAGYVRVGNGTGTVEFDPTVDGSTMETNILKVNCDLFLQGLSGRYVGFYLKNEADSIIAGYYANYYDNKVDATSNLPVVLGNLKYASGSSYANKPPQGALDIEGNPVTGTTCAKNSFEVIIDYGRGSIYCTTTSDNGVATTEEQVFDKSIPTKFVLQSNYNNNDRRIWFDNLKIVRVKAGSCEPLPTGITEFDSEATYKAPAKVIVNGRILINGKYDLNGIQVRK